MWLFGKCTKCKQKIERCESILYCKCKQKEDKHWKPLNPSDEEMEHYAPDEVSEGNSEIIPQSSVISNPQKPSKPA